MIDLSKVYEIKDILSNKVIDSIKDTLGNIIYETWEILSKSGIPPLSFKSSGAPLINYKMYGNSVQDGIPTPSTPIEVESVGEKTNNLININAITSDSYAISGNTVQVGINTTNSSTSSGITLQQLCPDMVAGKTYKIYYDANADNSFISIGSYSSANFWLSGSKKTITETQLSTLVRFGGGVAGSSRKVTFSNIQVVEDRTEVTDYEPYGYKIPVKASNGIEEIITNIYLDEPLRKVGNYADYIDFENSKIIRNIKRIYLKEMEWAQHRNYSNIYYANSDELVPGINPLCNILDSTTYEASASIANMKKDYCIKMHYSSRALYISDSAHTTVEEFVESLGDGYMIHVLETPIEETIELPNILTTKGTITLEVDTTIQPSNVEVTYEGKE